MQERGVKLDHATLNRCVLKYVPLPDKQFCKVRQIKYLDKIVS